MTQDREKYQDAESSSLMLAVAEELSAKKAQDIVVLDISSHAAYADTLIIVTATSKRHAQSLADSIVFQKKTMLGYTAPVEGYAQGDWILVDLGNVIVNIFQPEVRKIFNLEGLWSGAQILKDTRHSGTLSQRCLEEEKIC